MDGWMDNGWVNMYIKLKAQFPVLEQRFSVMLVILSCTLLLKHVCLNFSSLRRPLLSLPSFPSQVAAERLGKVTELFFPTAPVEELLPWVLEGSRG
jgi:hypothetical protein